MPELAGMHHLKFAVADLADSEAFHTRMSEARRLWDADHLDGDGSLYKVICAIADLGPLLELRLNPEAAAAQAGFDPVTIAVATTAELDRRIEKLDRLCIPHSGLLVDIRAWLVVFDDPDGQRLRQSTLEGHGPDLLPSTESPWLSAP